MGVGLSREIVYVPSCKCSCRNYISQMFFGGLLVRVDAQGDANELEVDFAVCVGISKISCIHVPNWLRLDRVISLINLRWGSRLSQRSFSLNWIKSTNFHTKYGILVWRHGISASCLEQKNKKAPQTTHHSFELAFITLILGCRIVYRERIRPIFMYSHYRSLVPTSITVIWCRPYGDELFIEHVLETFLH
jgi:hypothetical protein